MDLTSNSQAMHISIGIQKKERRRRIIMGSVFLAAALFIWIVLLTIFNLEL